MINNNLPRGDVKLADVLDLFRKQLMAGFFCHGIATIKSFDKTTQTAQAIMVYKQTVFRLNAKTKQYEPTLLTYAPLLDCPVVVLGGGKGRIEFPIQPGDTCLVAFNDRDLSDWVKNGQTNRPPDTSRFHSYSDAILIVGLNSMNNAWEGYNDDRVAIKFDTTIIELKEKIKLANNMTDLKTVMNGMLDMFTTVLGTGSTPPGGGVVTFAGLAQVAAYKTDVGELLE